jgi:23S rRNA (adenine2503-C2)-methyltransferase
VLIPDEKRRTACISSQVGCPVGCGFCASGVGGLQRQLAPGEIVEQAMRVRQLCDEAHPLSNIVFMGLGEPLANYGSVLAAVRVINAEEGLNIGARKITISTVGLPTQIRKLAKEGLQVNLAISLHAPNDRLRKELIPWAKNTSIEDLVVAGRDFFETTGREITLEYILLAGVNDQLDHAHQLTKICRQMRCNVNLIRYNPVADLGFERPDSYSAHKFAEELRSRGVNVHVRKSRGADIDAACGQLRRKNLGAGSRREGQPRPE